MVRSMMKMCLVFFCFSLFGQLPDFKEGEALKAEQLNQLVEEIKKIKNERSESLPVGTIVAFAGSSPPTNWLFCDGSAIPDGENYQTLREVIGERFGTNRNGAALLPDLQGRTVVGAGEGKGLSVRRIGYKDGAEVHVLSRNELPIHTHKPKSFPVLINSPDGTAGNAFGTGKGHIVSEGNPLENVGKNEAHNNMQPFLVVNYIIKAN